MANRFWVTGGTGNWNSATNWSATSGGASGASVPGSVDAALLDASSGAGTVTLDISPIIQTLTCTGFTGTLAFGTNTISLNSIGTIFTGSTTMTVTGTPLIICTNSSVSNRTITPTAVTEANSISFRITAGTGVFAPTASQNVRSLDFTDGVNPTGYAGPFSANAITVFGNFKASTGMTQTAGTGVITFAATSGTQQITTNGVTFDRPITQNGIGGTVQLQDNLTMGSTRTFTLTAGTLDLSVGNRTLSTGLFASSNSNVRSVAFGTGNITLTQNAASIYNTSTGTNLTFTGTPVVNLIYSGSTGTRTITSATNAGAFTSFPTFNVSAGSDIVSFANTGSTGCLSLNFTGFTGTCSSLPRSFVNNLTLVSGMTLTNTGTIAFVGTSGTQQVTSAGLTLDCQINFTGVGGTVAFQDALTQGSTRAFTVTNGTVQLKNGVTSTVGAFATSGTNQKFLQSTTPGSQATLSQASGTVNASYLTIRDINAVGGAEWDAFVNQQNIDAGNNDGWDFGISPIVGSYEYTYQLRSFTQPRRF